MTSYTSAVYWPPVIDYDTFLAMWWDIFNQYWIDSQGY